MTDESYDLNDGYGDLYIPHIPEQQDSRPPPWEPNRSADVIGIKLSFIQGQRLKGIAKFRLFTPNSKHRAASSPL